MLNGGVTSDIPARARLMSLQSDGSIKLNATGNNRIVEEDDSDSNLITRQQSNQGQVLVKRDKR